MHIYHLQVHLVCHVKIIDWIGLSSVVRPRQHRIGYMEMVFTGQKTQQTVSKY